MEKYANIDFLEAEMDKFNIIEKEQNRKTAGVIKTIQEGIEQEDKKALHNVGEGDDDFDQMRTTKTGFGAFGDKKAQAHGNLDGGDDDEDEDEDDEDVDINDDEDGIDQDDDDDGRNDDF